MADRPIDEKSDLEAAAAQEVRELLVQARQEANQTAAAKPRADGLDVRYVRVLRDEPHPHAPDTTLQDQRAAFLSALAQLVEASDQLRDAWDNDHLRNADVTGYPSWMPDFGEVPLGLRIWLEQQTAAWGPRTKDQEHRAPARESERDR